MRVRALLVVAAVVAALSSCLSWLTGPEAVALESLSFRDSVVTIGAQLWLTAVAAERVTDGRVLTELTTAGGDREELTLLARLCPPLLGRRPTEPGSDPIYCDRVDIGYDPTATDLARLQPLLHKIRGTVEVHLAVLAAVSVLVPWGTVADALAEAEKYPGVVYAEPSTPGVLNGNYREALALGLRTHEVSITTAATTRRAGDGLLQVRSGDVVTASYRQPNGMLLQATAQVRA